MKNEFVLAINEIIDQRELPREIILDALKTALVSAYRRDVSVSSAQNVEAEIDMEAGRVMLLVEKEVVQSVQDVRTEIKLEDARQYVPEAVLNETVMVPVAEPRGFGRIAAQTAKQVILQKIREAERESLYEEYVEREGDLITGTVQSQSPQGVTISLGRAEALLPRSHMMPGEVYRQHDKVRTCLLEVKRGNRGPQIIVSRSHRNMLRRLLEYEVPEIYNGQVEIKNIAREAGHRSKVAVAALQEGVDPVGACVGMRGIRIQNIVRELNEEKIDVIEWNADVATFITKALSPARVTGVFLDEYADSGRGGMGTATVIVPDDQLSLAIGREGQNARLAAKLTGWRIDIKSVSEAVSSAFNSAESEALTALNEQHAELVEDIQRILAKREQGRPVMPEEFQTLIRYARLAEQVQLDGRRAVNKKQQEYVDTVRETLPPVAFTTRISELQLPAPVARTLSNRFDSVGDIMLYMLVDEVRVRRALKRIPQEDIFEQVKGVVEAFILDIPEAEEVVDEPAEEAVPADAVEADVAEAVTEDAPVEETPAEEEAPAPEAPVAEVLEPDAVPPALVEPELEPEPVVVEKPKVVKRKSAVPEESFSLEAEEENLDRDKQKKKSKSRRRQLVYDENAGQVVARRKRKGSRKRSSFLDGYEEES